AETGDIGDVQETAAPFSGYNPNPSGGRHFVAAALSSLHRLDVRLHVFRRKSKPEIQAAPREGFVKRLRARLNRGAGWLSYDLAKLIPGRAIDEEVLEELETRLIMADVGVESTERILEDVRKRLARKELKDVGALMAGLRQAMIDILLPVEAPLDIPPDVR